METRADFTEYSKSLAHERMRHDLEAHSLRVVTHEFIETAIGTEKAVAMVYIPQALQALAVDYALKAYERAKIVKTSDCKRAAMNLRKYSEEYLSYLGNRLGSAEAVDAYNSYISMFDKYVETEQWLAMMQSELDAKNKSKKDPQVSAYVQAAIALLDAAQRYESKVQRELESKLGRNLQYARIAPLESLMENLMQMRICGYGMAMSKQMQDWVKVFETKAALFIPTILEKEKEVLERLKVKEQIEKAKAL